MTRRARTPPLSGRACQAAARVFAFDRTLEGAFLQLDADVQIERSSEGRRADMRAWLALLRLLVVAVPTTMALRVLELRWPEWRVVLDILGRLGAMPLGACASSALLESLWPPSSGTGQLSPLVPVMVFMTWLLVGDRLVARVPRPQLSGALIATLAGVFGGWMAFGVWAEPAWVGNESLTFSQVTLRGLLLPALAAQAAWLSAQLALRGRSVWDEISTMAVVGVVIAGVVLTLPATIVVHQLNDTQLTLLCLALVPLSLIATAALSARIAGNPISPELAS